MSNAWRQLRQYPSAIAGLVIILFFVGIAIYTVIAIPYPEALKLWRGGEEVVAQNPRNARPIWFNWFAREDLPPTVILDSREDGVAELEFNEISADIDEKIITMSFDYDYSTFLPELAFFINAEFEEKQPFLEITWITPDGRELRAGEVTPGSNELYRPTLDERVMRRIDARTAEVGFFMTPDAAEETPLRGTYQVRIAGLLFEEDTDFDVRLVMYGAVHGTAGTDHLRRDLSVALLWGTPIAMAFGLVAAIFITIANMTLAALSVWYGGTVDTVIQRITDVNLILPGLPILILIGTLYSRSIWIILGVVIGLGIFGGGIKTYRSIFLQTRELPYIEAAQAYGASSTRIIFRYLIPRVIPLMIPTLVTAVPGFVFTEASLAVLGLGDPVLPTWGKVIENARTQGALFNGYYYWMLEPAVLMMLVGVGFALVGFALDRIFNPRLREI
ncbi:MAG: ABC transporter permease [Candidatus Promineifilaceae bacterium]